MFRVTDQFPPNSVANCCYFCRADQRTKFGGKKERVIATDRIIEREGRVSICETCIVEAAGLVDMLTAGKAKNLKEKCDALQTQSQLLKNELVLTQEALDALRRVDLLK